MAEITRPIGELHANTRNPRQIQKKKLRMLKDAVKEFGDIGGVVFNLTTNQLVGGHQRLQAYRDFGNKQVIIERTYEPPTPTGTVREGYFMISGERHAYREVKWSEAKETAANLAANKQAGDWLLPELKDMLHELRASDVDNALSMFSESEIQALIGDDKADDEKQSDYEPSYGISVKCDDAEQQMHVLALLEHEGVACKLTAR